ncbi:hypothetical protein [Nostoc sp. WHI]|uniref:hypothetical protein n=1 Tax=Nostoc sp. WHI TaxID=2650611 RepID=UPI0018C4DD07|nr:hypothetical protein [Nostoc sp. WHI]MBG1265343.1 hypothetical protein [Nostoc sp. WHI]
MSIQEVQLKVNPLLGQKTWGVSLGFGSFLTLEFGQPLPPSNEHQKIHGEWHLWLYNCVWRLEEEDRILAASGDERDQLETAIHRLDNLTLQSIDLLPPAWDAVFTFEHQVVLRLFAIYSQDYDHWFLYAPDGNVLSVGPGSCWSYGSSTAIPA